MVRRSSPSPGKHDECAPGLHQLCEAGEAFQISGLVAVDVEMVGVGRGHHGDERGEVVERPVVFIGLDHRPGRLRSRHEVAVDVAQYAAEEGVAPLVRVAQYVGDHRRCRGLAVGAGHTYSLAVACDLPQQFGALHYAEAVVAKPPQLPVALRHCRSPHHQGVAGVAPWLPDELRVIVEDDSRPFLPERVCEGRGGAVVARHFGAPQQIVSYKIGHAYAAGPYEIQSLICHGYLIFPYL